jgi:lipopolysaccharide transport system ATP-binding protein
MVMRLGFSIALQMDFDVLLVDEVLAVGDISFQRKCLGQMEQIAGTGRTVFFVSHNMNAVRGLCSRAVQIEGGRLVADGSADQVVHDYIAQQTSSAAVLELPRALGKEDELLITAVRVLDDAGRAVGPFHTTNPIIVEIDVDVARTNSAYQVGFDLLAGGGPAFRSWHTDGPPDDWPALHLGRNTVTCVIPAGMLNAGSYAVAPRADVYKSHWIVNGDEAIWFEVVKDHLVSPFSWVRNPGPVAPLLEWRAVERGPQTDGDGSGLVTPVPEWDTAPEPGSFAE